ncbi:MAG: hypothetical protein WAM28_07650 [Chlamydiales bacterium]
MTSKEIAPSQGATYLFPQFKEIKESLNELHSTVEHLPNTPHQNDLFKKAEELVNALEGRITQGPYRRFSNSPYAKNAVKGVSEGDKIQVSRGSPTTC